MAIVQFDLTPLAKELGGHPEMLFVDEHESVYRVIEHATGRVVGILRSDGSFGPYKIEPNPGATPVVATLSDESGPASSS